MRITLPFPVPLHACFIKRRGGGGIPTKRYQAYATEAGWMIRAQSPKPISGPVRIRIELVAPDRRERDADNLGKCVFDTLTRNRLIDGDSNRTIKSHTFAWVEAGPPCRVTIEPHKEDA
ncbi:RusA family crossover junction endodeoxyribonuclease [Stappia indica]|uniref:RusA family crossover junction endodeoxyribonuclease n=1 Tax=Stappia indica TaxID=538381 RepID=UPI001CD5A1EF|nr:RusA family crossover junction endodeoxyribonuclease [Stappia indica]MCA1298016.1 RusA family crossover junction endodeoxyribonuclease [Stappia indica]